MLEGIATVGLITAPRGLEYRRVPLVTDCFPLLTQPLAPSCLGIELTRNDTGELLCNQLPVYGKGDVTTDKFDESGYVALPPCVWGDDGLVDAPIIPKGTYIRSVKRNRNTFVGHYGEMASWQMRGVCHDDNGQVMVCPSFAP